MGEVRVLDLFGGAGGVACGIDAVGAEHVSVEWSETAAAVARAAGHRVVVGDVRDPAVIAEAVATLGGPPDLVWASPPCQAWSTAGKRLGAHDERNGWPWTLDVLDALALPPLIAENVPGMLHHSGEHCGDTERCAGCYVHGWLLPELRRRYAHVDLRVLDAADLGVPQHRVRVIIQARHDAPRWPALTHDDPAGMLVAAGVREPWVSVREALGRAIIGGGTRGRGVAEWRPRLVDGEPSPTVTGTEGRGCATDARRASRAFGRRLTVAECAALQSFPADYPWAASGTGEAQYLAVGNAVPPPMAAALVGAYRA